MLNRAQSIQQRFCTEIDNLAVFVKLLQDREQYDTRQLTSYVHSTLLKFNLLPTEIAVGDYFYHGQEQNVSDLVSLVSEQQGKITMLIKEATDQLAEHPRASMPPNVRDLLHGTTLYLIENIGYPFDQGLIRWLRDRLIEQYAENISDEDEYEDMVQMVDAAVNVATYTKLQDVISELRRLNENVRRLEVTQRLFEIDSPINIYRQAFINLMTLFDATVKESVRVVLSEHFFAVMPHFTHGKVSLKLSEFASFREVQDYVIQDNFDKRRLRDILEILLSKLKVEFCDSDGHDFFADLLEMINRRNVHVHNRGIVDEQYLKQNMIGSTRFNPYNYQIGDYAYIDVVYWRKVLGLSRSCISLIIDWIETL